MAYIDKINVGGTTHTLALTPNKGDSNTPVYFDSNGLPQACTSLDLNAAGLDYPAQLSTQEALDGFLSTNTFKAGYWNSFTPTGLISNGIILSGGWTSTNYGFQIAIDDDPTYKIWLRQKSSSWSDWKAIPMADGTHATGTWGINVTGRSRFLETKHADGSAWYGDSYPIYAQWETSNICKLKCDNYYTKVDYCNSVPWSGITDKPSSYTPSSHSHSSITYLDTRGDNQSPDAVVAGLSVHLKTNGTDGISNGGSYHAVLNVKDWGDYSGGPYWQATVTANDNMYYRRSTSGTAWGGWRKVWAQGDSVTSAVWNDYAEYRKSDCQEFGRVLMEKGDDSLTVTNERLSHFAGISSDTWGFSQGETDKAKTPIAVAGRVLAYPYQDRNNYKPGDCVCAAPNGTVDIMTREEVIQWPDRIVGTVSCVPDYEEWGGGELADRDPVKVNGRIWIKVK